MAWPLWALPLAGLELLSAARTALAAHRRSRQPSPFRAAIAGAVSGYAIFHLDTPVHQQIILYLFGRACLGFVRNLAFHLELGVGGSVGGVRVWPFFAAACWAAVMAQWEWNKNSLQGGLVKSMEFIYRDDHVTGAARWAALLPACLATLAGLQGGGSSPSGKSGPLPK